MSCFCKRKTKIEERFMLYPSNFLFPAFTKLRQSNNLVRTTKYRFYNFLFLNLFEQFKRYSNLFFIFCVILNFIPQIGTYSKETAIIPILFILITTLVKDGVEDLRRYVSDKKVNNLRVLKYDEITMQFTPCFWKDIKAGDFVQISSSQRIPADLLLYYSSDISGVCYIETANIDGETTLKQRSIMKPIDSDSNNFEEIFKYYFLELETPNKEIYKFNGNLFDSRTGKCVRNLKFTNIVLRDTILRNTQEVRGIVVYAGNETKIFMNNNKARFKRSLLEDQLNIDMLMCLVILFIVCLMSGAGYTFWLEGFTNKVFVVYLSQNSLLLDNIVLQGFYQFWGNIIIFQSIIPISLYVTMELVKAHQIFHINNDLALYDENLEKRIEVKAYNITEDMGQIKHIFCDKTGTLTDNVMLFKKVSIYGKIYETEDDSLKLKANDSSVASSSSNSFIDDFLKVALICNTTVISKTETREKKLVHINIDTITNADSVSVSFGQSSSKEASDLSFFGIENKIITESIPPVILEDTIPIPKDLTQLHYEKAESVQSISSFNKSIIKPNQITFHRPMTNSELYPLILSESPDEDALVKMCLDNGHKLHYRSIDKLIIWNEIELKWMNFDILKVLSFDSIRKCMSVIVREIGTKEIILYCKGADSTMLKKMEINSENSHLLEKIKSDIHSFASDGLRTLVMGRRIIEENEFITFEDHLQKADSEIINNEEAVRNVFNSIEKNLDLVGAVGLEDKLQKFVPEVLECLKEAGINIWVLTGDKKETAISIAFSTKLFSENMTLLEISSDNKEKLIEELMSLKLQVEKSMCNSKLATDVQACEHENFGLVIDGSSLSIILDSNESDENLKDLFLHIAYFCNSVICCRCTPIQKGEIVKLIKTEYKVRTLAIGDGANDVNMIQTADVGIGISGKEGSQATMASDFAISQFKYLKRLILVHGHWSYDKLARMSLYMFYKDMTFIFLLILSLLIGIKIQMRAKSETAFLSMVYYFYQFVCGFSGSRAIDQTTQLTFHVIQMGLPPIIYGIWDKDFSDEILMANPQIYKTGINSKMFRPRDFWRFIVDAIWQAFCTFLIPWLCYNDTEIDMGEFGIVSISCVMIILLSQILIESKHWSPFHWGACVGCLGIGFYLEIFILNTLCVNVFDCNSDNPYKVLHHTLRRGKTYIVIAITTGCALYPRLFIKGILLDSRNSIYYEAHRRMTEMNILKWSSNLLTTRKYIENINQYDFRNSPFYLGNLEENKVVNCDKCTYINERSSSSKKPFERKYQKSKIAPCDA